MNYKGLKEFYQVRFQGQLQMNQIKIELAKEIPRKKYIP